MARPWPILLIGADPARLEEATRVLQEAGAEVERASDRGAAEARLIDRRFESVWVDMTDLDSGLQTLSALDGFAPELPLIALNLPLSASEDALSRGALGMVEAPIERGRVLVALRQVRALRNLTQARHAGLAETRANLRFYEDVLRSVGEGILVFDKRGHVRLQNDEARRLLGEEGSEETGEAGEKLRKSVVAQTLQQLASALAEGSEERRMLVVDGDARRLHVAVQTSPLRGADGQTQGAIAVLRDRSTEMLLEEQLVHTERLASLGGLLASIAHDINNPLTCVTGCAEIGLMAAADAEAAAENSEGPARTALESASKEMKDLFRQIQEAGTRCQSIANNLLAYSRRVPSQGRRASINDLIHRTVDFVGRYRKLAGVELKFELDPALPMLIVNEAELEQALTNLMDNAVQAMEDRQVRRLTLRTRSLPRFAEIEVEDTGPGIPEGRLKRIWSPFFTTKASGTGLGLHITRRVIEHQNGEISVVSRVGEGTRFTIRLPLA